MLKLRESSPVIILWGNGESITWKIVIKIAKEGKRQWYIIQSWTIILYSERQRTKTNFKLNFNAFKNLGTDKELILGEISIGGPKITWGHQNYSETPTLIQINQTITKPDLHVPNQTMHVLNHFLPNFLLETIISCFLKRNSKQIILFETKNGL